MKLQVAVLLLCVIAMAAARPGCRGSYGKRSPGCHGNRNGNRNYGGSGGGQQGRSGRVGSLQDGLRSLKLNTLLSLIESAGLVSALNPSGSSDLTVFAPTDRALATFIGSLPSAPDAETVKTVLLNHVISGKALSKDISNGLTVQNLAGNDMKFRVRGGGVTIGGARIGKTDIPYGRLTIHILDDVINPANLPGRR